MRFSQLNTVTRSGLKGEIIMVETDVVRGLFHFSIVGLPDKSIEESRERICSAIKNSGFDSPKTKHHKITSSLVPAHVKKAGPSFDLPIALSYLHAIGIFNVGLEKTVFIGELSLDGTIRSVVGILQMVMHAISQGFENIFIPYENHSELLMVIRKYPSINIFIPKSLSDVTRHLKGEMLLEKISIPDKEKGTDNDQDVDKATSRFNSYNDFKDIEGQEVAKRAAIIAVAGGHNLLFIGPPGTGKTLIARACAGIMPDPSEDERLEISLIQSLHSTKHADSTKRPFRSPHHTSSYTAMIGGGQNPRPGEVTMAHNGILFLDEFPEFDRRVIESLREPLEEGLVKIARSKEHETFPARFILIAAANPCPCGFRGSKKKRCLCKQSDIARYTKKISGPILDRIDILVQISEAGDKQDIIEERVSSERIQENITKARAVQKERNLQFGISKETNAEIPFEKIMEIINIDEESKTIFEQGSEQLSLSMRARHKVLRVARTIADLAESEKIKAPHILEALSFRLREL